MSSTATLRFSGALDDSNVKLFELEPGMEDTLSRGDRFFIKGSTSKKAAGLVLCSETKTFSMRKAETSNVVLVVNGVDEPAAKKRKMAGSDAEAQTGGGRVATVSASVGEFYQLTETAPKFVQNFMDGASSIQAALKAFVDAVKAGEYPREEHTYS